MLAISLPTNDDLLLIAIGVCALAGFVVGIAQFIWLFSAPYAEPSDSTSTSEPAIIRRVPRTRMWLLTVTLGSLLVGGGAGYALAILMQQMSVGILKFLVFLVLLAVVLVSLTVSGFILDLQNRLVRKRNERHRTDLFRMAAIAAFGVGVAWTAGFRLPEFGDIATVSLRGLNQRVDILRLVAAWTFGAGTIGICRKLMEGRPGKKGAVVVWLVIPGLGALFRGAYGDIAPRASDTELFSEARDLLSGGSHDFILKMAEVQLLGLIGLATFMFLLIAPMLDARDESPGLTTLHSGPRRGLALALTLGILTMLYAHAPASETAPNTRDLWAFVAASWFGTSITLSAAPLWRAYRSVTPTLAPVVSWAKRREWVVPALAVLLVPGGLWALSTIPSLAFAAFLISALGSVGVGGWKEDRAPEDPVAEVFA